MFKTANRHTPIHIDLVMALANAMYRPQQMGVVKVVAHQKDASLHTALNNEADKLAKVAAGLQQQG